MIKSWLFEFFPAYSPAESTRGISEPDHDVQKVQERFRRFFELWRRDEALGLDGIFFSEHHFGPAFSPSPNLVMAHLGALTSTLRIGVMGTVSPLATPWRVVEEFGMLDHLTQGRLEMGVASGIPPELMPIGMSMEEAGERHAEIMDVLHASRNEPLISHHGKHWDFDNLSLPPHFLQPDPAIWTAAVSPASFERAGAHGWKVCSGFLSVEDLINRFDVYRDAANTAGHDPSPDDIAIRRPVAFIEPGEDRQTAKARIGAAFARTFFDLPPERAPQVSKDELIVGTPEQVTEEIVRQCRATHCGNFLFAPASPDFDEVTRTHEIFGAEVVPVLRGTEVGASAATTVA